MLADSEYISGTYTVVCVELVFATILAAIHILVYPPVVDKNGRIEAPGNSDVVAGQLQRTR